MGHWHSTTWKKLPGLPNASRMVPIWSHLDKKVVGRAYTKTHPAWAHVPLVVHDVHFGKGWTGSFKALSSV